MLVNFATLLPMKSNTADDDSLEAIANRLEFLRKEKRLKQREFAALIGVMPTQYNNWVRKRSRITMEGAKKVSRAYNVSLDFLIFGRTDTLSAHLAKSWALSRLEETSAKSSE